MKEQLDGETVREVRNMSNSLAECKNQMVKGKKGKVRKWGRLRHYSRIGFLYPYPEVVPSFISRGAARRTTTTSASEGRNYE
jgi:hypothetical protein